VKFWIDTEYDDSGDRVELISLAAVADDNREYYAVSNEFEIDAVKPFVKQHVIPKLPPNDSDEWMSMDAIRDTFLEFVGTEQAEFWTHNPTYDWYLVTWNFLHGWDHLPSNWPFECYDLAQWAFHLGVAMPTPDESIAHDALVDARFHRDVYNYLAGEQAAQSRGK
jgi:hypothetical protein